MEQRQMAKRYLAVVRILKNPSLQSPQSWDNLPDPCIAVIIDKLSISELFIITSLNKHWHSARASALARRKVMRIKVLLSEVDYDYIPDSLSSPIVYLSRFLPNGHDYNLPQNELPLSSLTRETMQRIQKDFPNIEHLTLELCYQFAEQFDLEYFQQFIESQQKLVKLCIFHCFEGSGKIRCILSELQTLWRAINAAPATLERLSFFYFHTNTQLFYWQPNNVQFNVTLLGCLKELHYTSMSRFGTEAILPELERLTPQNQLLERIELKDPLTDVSVERLMRIGGRFQTRLNRLSVCNIRPVTLINLCRHFVWLNGLEVILKEEIHEELNEGDVMEDVVIRFFAREGGRDVGGEGGGEGDEDGLGEGVRPQVGNGAAVGIDHQDKLDYIKTVDILSVHAPPHLSVLQIYNLKLDQLNQVNASIPRLNCVKLFLNIDDLSEHYNIDQRHKHYFLGLFVDSIHRTYPNATYIYLDFEDLINCGAPGHTGPDGCGSLLISPLARMFELSGRLLGVRLITFGVTHKIDRDNIKEVYENLHRSAPYVERLKCQDWFTFRQEKLARLSEILDYLLIFKTIYTGQHEKLPRSVCLNILYKYWDTSHPFVEEVTFLPPDEKAHLDQSKLDWVLSHLMPYLDECFLPNFNEEHFPGLNGGLVSSLKRLIGKNDITASMNFLVENKEQLCPEHHMWLVYNAALYWNGKQSPMEEVVQHKRRNSTS